MNGLIGRQRPKSRAAAACEASVLDMSQSLQTNGTDFYKLVPFFSILHSYQNLLVTENNADQHWLLFLKRFNKCFTIPGFQL